MTEDEAKILVLLQDKFDTDTTSLYFAIKQPKNVADKYWYGDLGFFQVLPYYEDGSDIGEHIVYYAETADDNYDLSEIEVDELVPVFILKDLAKIMKKNLPNKKMLELKLKQMFRKLF